ncbi:cyclopropane-fatty-acyl-phospholipid synthase, putative [Ketogulonicigenium vulgare Y25]|uniref:SAM-dependent methyltransferase n=1 Tax=Ketogulonicigenium vulgare TaxID=92945 RepID=UPI0001E67B62|nr:class I SAM-dependent methyltransferase [Ketogulonicigenium vulgare]ADO42734.1 cyclopropane-fatty-acyl-phospholipid synthase, putative [Ketogulonicigenium vulgare Y25]
MTQITRTRHLVALEGLEHGRLHLRTPEGQQYQFGSTGPEADIEIRDWSVLARLAARGNVGLGEAWINGQWHGSSLENVLALMLRNAAPDWSAPGPFSALRGRLAGRVLRRATRAPGWAGNEFFQLWLDPGMSLSGALFAEGDDLAAAQARKNARIISRLSPGKRLLDISGQWGSFAEAAAGSGYHVTTLAGNAAQKGYADARLDGRAQVALQPLARAVRHPQSYGAFNNIVAIEALETLPERDWPAFFSLIKANLAPGGRAIVQSVTVPDAEFSMHRSRADLVRQHLMSGGVLPCNATIMRDAAGAGLSLRAQHDFGADYALTCRMWRGAADLPDVAGAVTG